MRLKQKEAANKKAVKLTVFVLEFKILLNIILIVNKKVQASNKPNSVKDNHLSGPSITLGI